MLLETSYTSEEVPLPAELKQIGLDPSVLHAVQLLFPKGRGLLLLALLCRYAVVQQLVLPEIGLVNVAVIAFASVEVFAREHGWGKDTVLRYMTLLCALGILVRQKTRGQSVLYLPLTSWSPSQARFAALDTLLIEHTARPKLQQLARSVKERFHLLYGSPNLSLFDEVSQTLTEVQELLKKRLCASKRLLLHVRLEDLKGRLETHKGDFQARTEDHIVPRHVIQGDASSDEGLGHAGKGDFEQQKGQRSGHGVIQKGGVALHTRHTIAQQGDLRRLLAIADVAPLAQQGDFQWGEGEQRPSHSAEQGDLADTGKELLTDHLTEQGDLGKTSRACLIQKGDSTKQRAGMVAERGDFAQGSASTLNVRNISFSKKEDSTNVQREQTPWDELAECVEGHTGSSYQYQRYLESTDSRLVLATYLYVQEEVWSKQNTSKPVEKPGAYFHTMIGAWTKFTSYETACQAYTDAYAQLQARGKMPSPRDRLPGIPSRLQTLVERFQGWSYADVRDELAVLWHRQSTGSTAFVSVPTQETPSEKAFEPEEVPARWMTTQSEAEALICQIQQQAPLIGAHAEQLCIRPYRVRGSGIQAFVVDAIVERVPQVYAAPSQWEAYFLPYLKDLEEEQCKSESPQL